jgi:hypothetical protein
MAYGATICTVHVEMNRNQLGDIFARLKPKLVLYQDGLKLDDLLAAVPAPRLRLGRLGEPAAETFFAEAARAAPGDAQTAARPDDDAVILFVGHQRAAQGVVLGFGEHLAGIDPPPRASSPPTTGCMISGPSTGHRRNCWARWCRSTAARPRHSAEILRQPLLQRVHETRHGRDRQSNHHQFLLNGKQGRDP